MDILTFIHLLALGNGVSALIFLIFIRRYKKSDISLKYFTLGKLLQTIAWLVFILNWNNLNPLVMSIANSFQYAGLSTEVLGFILLFSKKHKRNTIIAITACSLWIILFSLFSSNIPVRVFISSLMFFTLYAALFVRIQMAKSRTLILGLVAWFALTFAFVHLARGCYALYASVDLELNKVILVQVLTGYISVLITFTFPVFLLLIVIEKDNLRLNKLNATKTKFFRIIGHDLRAPFSQLHQIAQIIELKKEDLSTADLERLAETIKVSSLRTSKLLDDVLTWAQAESEVISVKSELIDVNKCVQENIELVHPKANNKNLVLENSTSLSAQVNCDPNMFNSIIRNLLSNAIKFSFNNSQILIESSVDKNCCTISVKDTGIGIAQKNIRKLFEIDSDFTTLGTAKEQGTGIGLSICKEFVEKNKGKIWVESVVDKGATFYFSLPKE